MKKIKITILIFLVIIIAVVSVVFATKPAFLVTPPSPVACTEEAKLCPDGSYVGRTGPQCQFSSCPTNATGTSTATTTPISTTTPKTSGITGTVLLGPRCPVMRDPPDPQCDDRPYQTNLVVTTPDGARTIVQFSSNTTGKFKVNVPPGEYVIRSAPTSNFYPRCSSNGNVIVKAGVFTDTAVSCDTGIR